MSYSGEAIDAVKDYFEEVGIILYPTNSDVVDNKTKANIVKFGDLEFKDNHGDALLRLNIVRGTFISRASALGFRGQFYILFPGGDISNVENGRVIWRRTAAQYSSDATNQWGDPVYVNDVPGYRLTKRLRVELTLSDFRSRLLKRIISHPEEIDGKFSPNFLKTFFMSDYYEIKEELSEQVRNKLHS